MEDSRCRGIFVLLLFVLQVVEFAHSMARANIISWTSIKEVAKLVVPPLSSSLHKGQMGRIGILGGSEEYTGAPFYSAKSSLMLGADLSFVFCAEAATIPIKSYSPEVMVVPFYTKEQERATSSPSSSLSMLASIVEESGKIVIGYFSRLHTLVIGPGLGRKTVAIETTKFIIKAAVEAQLPIVIDADGLYALNQDLSLIYGYKKCILTPNVVEFERLKQHASQLMGKDADVDVNLDDADDSDPYRQVLAVSKLLGGVTIFRKGAVDVISNGEVVFGINEEGSMRRCGGQGDILAGSLGLLSHWMQINAQELDPFSEKLFSVVSSSSSLSSSEKNDLGDDPLMPKLQGVSNFSNYSLTDTLWACIFASTLVRKAGKLGFVRKKRAMTSPDVIDSIGESYEWMMEA